MNEDTFNLSLRKFLKKVGVTSQRELENAVHTALQSGRLKGNEKLTATVMLTVPELGLSHETKDTINLE